MTKEKLFLSGACVFGLGAICFCTLSSLGQSRKLIDAKSRETHYTLKVNASTIERDSIVYSDIFSKHIISFKVKTSLNNDITFKINNSEYSYWVFEKNYLVCKKVKTPPEGSDPSLLSYLYNDYEFNNRNSRIHLTTKVEYTLSQDQVSFVEYNDNGHIRYPGKDDVTTVHDLTNDRYTKSYKPFMDRNSFGVNMSYETNEMILYNLSIYYDCK